MGQVLPMHNIFTLLQTDKQTQDLYSIGESFLDNSSLQNSQLSKHVHRSVRMDIGNSRSVSTSRYFQHSSCYSSDDVHVIEKSQEQLENKFGCVPLSTFCFIMGTSRIIRAF